MVATKHDLYQKKLYEFNDHGSVLEAAGVRKGFVFSTVRMNGLVVALVNTHTAADEDFGR